MIGEQSSDSFLLLALVFNILLTEIFRKSMRLGGPKLVFSVEMKLFIIWTKI